MNEAPACIRCHAPMEMGYVADVTHNGYTQQNWAPGEPKRRFWMGLKVNRKEFVPVRTLRCPRCGYLESYATPGSTSS